MGGTNVAVDWPNMWLSGRRSRKRIGAKGRAYFLYLLISRSTGTMFARMFLCVSTTPFGSAVAPDVKMISAIVSGFVVRGSKFVLRGSWFVVRGSWVVIRGSWVVGRGSWLVGRGSRFEVRGSRVSRRHTGRLASNTGTVSPTRIN